MTDASKADTLLAEFDGLSFSALHFAAKGDSKNTVLFCLPGGGASQGFFDLAPNYSFADLMTTKGYDVVTMDHPGTASNPLPDAHPFMAPRQSADYIGISLSHFLKTPALAGKDVIGIGHSMGGMMTVLTQARHDAFKAVTLLGSSAGGLEWGLDETEKTYIDRPDAFARDLETLTLNKFKVPFPPGMGGPSGKSITFGGENEEITEQLRTVTCQLYAAGGMMSMTRGSFKAEVEAITVPMFFAFGDHDIGIPPEDAPKDFINAASTELMVLENTGHNSFAFSSIHGLAERLDHWAASL